jgi:hypothetical protein
MHITIWTNRILSSSKCSAIDIPDEDITMFENKQSGYNNYIDTWPVMAPIRVIHYIVYAGKSF